MDENKGQQEQPHRMSLCTVLNTGLTILGDLGKECKHPFARFAFGLLVAAVMVAIVAVAAGGAGLATGAVLQRVSGLIH